MEAQQTPRPRMPRIIVIESTALFELGSRFERVDFAELLDLKKLLKFDIVVSHVSWLEFLRKRKTQVSECIKSKLGRVRIFISLFRPQYPDRLCIGLFALTDRSIA